MPSTDAQATRGGWCRITVKKNDLLLFPRALVALANAARRHGEGKVRFMVPVSLRRHLPKGERSMANLVGPKILDIEEKDTYRSIAKKFNLQLAEQREALSYNNMLKFANWLPFSCLENISKKNNQASGHPSSSQRKIKAAR